MLRILSLTILLLAVACGSGGERAVVLSATPLYRESGGKAGMLERGRALLLLGDSRKTNTGRITRDLVLTRIPGKTGRYWVVERESLPGGLVERRLYRGFFTNVYLVRNRAAYTFPVSDAPAGLTVSGGSGLIVVQKRKNWYRVHWADRFLWIHNPEFVVRPFYPVITITNASLGPVRIESSPWHVPGFGDERRYAPDRLLGRGRAAAWMSRGKGPGARLSFAWRRALPFRLRLTGGYSFSARSRSLYNRLRRIRVTSGERSVVFTVPDSEGPFPFPGVWTGNRLRLEILDIHPGGIRDRLVLQHMEIRPQ